MIENFRFDIRSASISGERSGAGSVSLVWGHGLTSSRRLEGELLGFDWEIICDVADVIRYDARGHGDSTVTRDPHGYSWQELARDQLALADALEIERYIACGASMGAGTALHAAVLSPERISGLVLVIPPTAWETRAAQRALYLSRADLIERGAIDEVIEAARMRPPPDPFDDAWHERFERNLRAANHHDMACVLRGAATADLPGRDEIRAMKVPTLICAWSGDAGHPLSTAEELHRLLPSSHLEIARTAMDLSEWSNTIADFVRSVG